MKNRLIISNRKARFEYQIEETFVAGIVLTGAEVKSLKKSEASISEAYCLFHQKKLIIRGMQINEFRNAGYINQEPLRDKQLLLRKKELKKIKSKVEIQGNTLIPLEIFISERNFLKLKIGLGKGKKLHDKRESLKQKDIQREIDRYL